MLLNTPIPNNVQNFPRPPTYELEDLPPSVRQTFALIPISLAIQIFTLAIIGPLPKTSPTRKFLPAVVCPIIIGLGIQSVLYCHHVTSPVINYAYGTAAICCTLQGLDILFVIPLRYDIPLTQVLKVANKPVSPTSPTWSQRLDWASACYNNPRMLCTPFEPSVLKQRRAKISGSRRSTFLLYRIGRLFLIWILLDILLAICRYDPYFSSFGQSAATSSTVALGALRTVFGASAIWMSVDGLHTLFCLLIVGLGGDNYKEWPDMFGFWTEEWYTIAEFWGIAWHGLFRQQFVFITHTVKSPLLRVFIPFMFSGILHFSGAHMQSRDGMPAIRFFMLQPIGIIVQQLVVGKGIKGLPMKLLVFISTMTWLIATGYEFIGAYARGGMYDIEPIPISWLSLFGLVEGNAWRWGGTLDHFRRH
ncbi:hypothetical protein ABW19_dt0209348 [Dactylella cylindrospora]|nr:hypothetical protein ABW19_dt0209348 [Dactylella cylindrospora]